MLQMIRNYLQDTLGRYDSAILWTKVQISLRRERLEEFAELCREDMRTYLAEFVAADPRIAIEEKNGGFMFSFKGKFMFRSAVCKYSDRVEVIIDTERFLRYDGRDTRTVKHFHCKPYAFKIRQRIITAFEENLREFLLKEVDQI